MGLFRRSESLHERLAREGGLDEGRPPHDTTPRWAETGIHGVPRPREWDASTLVEAPDVQGDDLGFVALPDGTLLVDGEGDAEPLADALEAQLTPPYRARAVRRDERFWGVAARRIAVVELPSEVKGKELELAVNDGETSLVVDGSREFGSLSELENLARARGLDSYVVRAQHLDGQLWEVQVSAL
jgi:hypothetical protein